MVTSEHVNEIFTALIAAQSEMGNAKKTSNNPFFNSKYADLAEIIEVSKMVLNKHGLAIIQSPGGDGSVITLTGRIIHTSGQWIEDTAVLKATKSDPQQAGSAITYARRYQLAAFFNIAQEDDDGNSASREDESEYETIKKALLDYINAGTFEHPENVKAAIDSKNLVNMRKALAVAKGK
jgi:hypothetical protein